MNFAINSGTYAIILIWKQYIADEMLPFATTWIDLKGNMLSEISQTKEDKYCMTSHLGGI